MIKTLTIEKTLARGGQGLVAITKYDGNNCAIKIDINESGTTEHSVLKKEFDILNKVIHDNVLTVYKFIAFDDKSIRVVVPEAELDNFRKKLEGDEIAMV